MSEVSNMAEHWIIPCSVKVYDIIEHFKKQNLVVWKNSFTIRKGDIAYIYIGSPAKINVGEIFKMLAPDTRVKVI